ncbi:scamp family-domain-containing protein [Halteromyces radiatus]|uniref:scamp family-domain-containing protein n=1 Tax=Halteromyces radiatus TaxID=101107 RepID=UPI00221FED8F|nr:scamp family-domain-containing protein [Halteromyces radiatus]KAI8099739.1 scamp family-domain-containing protein [Halteromyces radiatus]
MAQSSGPFDDPSNPFQDPSITSALNSQQQHHLEEQGTIGGYEMDQKTAVEDDFLTDTSFHHVQGAHDPFSGNGSSSSNNNQHDLLQEREETLRKKEQELADRERALEERQRRGIGRTGANNFPPCFPIMYLDISVEIPDEHQWTVWWLYREWLLFEITLVLNFIACLVVLFSHPPSVTSAPTNMGVALTEMFTHTAASFFLWYRPVYNAYMKEVSLYYFFYFIFNGFHIAYTFYMAVGIPNTGGAGLILLVTLFSDQYIASGVFTLLATICWLVMGVMAVYLYKRTYDHYKAAGHTFKEAKQDAMVHIGKSDVARGAAVSMAKQSVRR